ncbi:MAG: N-glycosylase/DNA lyase [Sulfolobales archaeon]
MVIYLNRDRAIELGIFLREFGSDKIELFEITDPQYKALENLYRELNDCSSLALLTVLNSIVSYQLSTTGEDYWWEFSRYQEFKKYSRNPEMLWDAFRRFLLSSRGNTSAREIKLRRISRLREEEFHIEIYAKFSDYAKDLGSFARRLSEILRQSIYDKTIVFSVKMLYYVARICNMKIGGFEEVKIPVDRRVAAVSFTSEMVDVVDNRDVVEYIMREKKTALRAWDIVSETSGIPLIKLDSLIWVIGRYVRDRDPVNRALRDLSNILRGYIDTKILSELINQFLRRRLPSS